MHAEGFEFSIINYPFSIPETEPRQKGSPSTPKIRNVKIQDLPLPPLP